MSLTSTASSSGSSRDSRGAMEEPSGPEAFTKNGAGSPRGRHPPNSNNNSSSRPNKKGPLSPFNSRAAAAPAHKLSYLGRVVREIVETERMYVQDLRSIVEVRGGGARRLRSGWPCSPALAHTPTATRKDGSPRDAFVLEVCSPWTGGEAADGSHCRGTLGQTSGSASRTCCGSPGSRCP